MFTVSNTTFVMFELEMNVGWKSQVIHCRIVQNSSDFNQWCHLQCCRLVWKLCNCDNKLWLYHCCNQFQKGMRQYEFKVSLNKSPHWLIIFPPLQCSPYQAVTGKLTACNTNLYRLELLRNLKNSTGEWQIQMMPL